MIDPVRKRWDWLDRPERPPSIDDVPSGAQFWLNGLYYKIGVHAKIFKWVEDCWTLSSHTSVSKMWRM